MIVKEITNMYNVIQNFYLLKIALIKLVKGLCFMTK